MILDTTSKVLQIVLGEAKTTTDCDLTASWTDNTTTAFTPGSTLGASNGVTAVTLVAAPASSTQRDVFEVTLHNNDTVTHNVTLQVFDGTNTRIIMKQTILAGGDFRYPPTNPSAGGAAAGDLSGTYPAPTVAKVNGVAYGSSPATNTFPLVTSANNATYTATSQIPGSTTNDSASAGNVGEYISSTVLIGAAVGMTTATAMDVTSISPTGGDWDVWGTVIGSVGGTTNITQYIGWISQTAATLPTFPNGGASTFNSYSSAAAGLSGALPVGMMRQSLSGTTTVRLSAQASFNTSTMASYGFIGARRRR